MSYIYINEGALNINSNKPGNMMDRHNAPEIVGSLVMDWALTESIKEHSLLYLCTRSLNAEYHPDQGDSPQHVVPAPEASLHISQDDEMVCSDLL